MPAPLAQLAEVLPRRRALALAVLTAAAALLEALGALALVPMLARVGGESATGQFAAWTREWTLASTVPLFILIVALRALAQHTRQMLALDIEIEVVDRLRVRTFAALLAADWRFLSASRMSEHRALLLSIVNRVGQAVHEAGAALSAALTLAALAVAAAILSPAGAAIGIGAGVAVFALFLPLQRRARRLGEEAGAAYDALYARLEEGLGGLRILKSFGREGAAAAGLAGDLEALRQTERAYLRGTGRARMALQVGAALVLAMLVWRNAGPGALAWPLLLPLVAILIRAVPLVGVLIESLQRWNGAAPALARIATLLSDIEAGREDAGAGADDIRLRQTVELRGVTIRYSGRSPGGHAALRDVSLRLHAGQALAVSGMSGAGKSTLADCLGGLLSPDKGDMLVDGTVLEPALRPRWRRAVAYVPQDAWLFAGSIRDNLLLADQAADDAALHEALTKAAAHFVSDLPGGLDHAVGEGGRQLSGGERQRLALARALVREPDLLILDEATSALDADNEAAIVAALGRLRGTTTMVIISHRSALLKLADTAITLEDGRVSATAG